MTTKLSPKQRTALGDLIYALDIASDHIKNDPRARSVYERFVAHAVMQHAERGKRNVIEAFELDL